MNHSQTIPPDTKDGTNIQIFLKPTFEDLQSHIEDLTAPPPAETNILNKLLDQLQEVSFGEDPTIKTIVVQSIDIILQTATQNRWGLCKRNGFIYIFNGQYWSTIDPEEFQMFLGNAAIRLGVQKLTAKHYEFKEKLFKQFQSTALLPTPEPATKKILINLKNGTFEFDPDNGNNLRTFSTSDFLTYQLPFSYDPDVKAPLFQAYLDRVLPDKSAQKVLAEYLGYIFVKNSTLKLEKAMILFGTGANGKSVFFDVVTALLGSENVSIYTLQSLTEPNGYYRAKIQNKLVNYASEINVKMETSYFKSLVSGEPVEARLPYGQPFEVTDYARLIFNCNELPKDVEQSNAFFRRFLIIPFSVTIPKEEQDRHLASRIIKNELTGVFTWVLSGLERLLKQGNFTVCDAADKALTEYQLQSDSAKLFLSDNDYIPHPTDHELIKDLYSLYRVFCNEEGFKPVNKTNFRKRLEAAGFVTERVSDGNVVYIKKQPNDPFI